MLIYSTVGNHFQKICLHYAEWKKRLRISVGSELHTPTIAEYVDFRFYYEVKEKFNYKFLRIN